MTRTYGNHMYIEGLIEPTLSMIYAVAWRNYVPNEMKVYIYLVLVITMMDSFPV